MYKQSARMRNGKVGKVIVVSDKEKDIETGKTEAIEEFQETEASENDIDFEKKIQELEDQNLRLQAEIQNMRRRHQTNREEAARYRAQDLAKEVLPVLDNLERALQTEVTDEAGQSLKQGVEMVLESFKRALTNAKVMEIEAEGKTFDPNFHEALAQIPATEGQESGIVVEVYEKGYMLHDRVLRAAKVIVTE